MNCLHTILRAELCWVNLSVSMESPSHLQNVLSAEHVVFGCSCIHVSALSFAILVCIRPYFCVAATWSEATQAPRIIPADDYYYRGCRTLCRRAVYMYLTSMTVVCGLRFPSWLWQSTTVRWLFEEVSHSDQVRTTWAYLTGQLGMPLPMAI